MVHENFVQQIKDDREKTIIVCNVTIDKLVEYALMMSKRHPESLKEFEATRKQ